MWLLLGLLPVTLAIAAAAVLPELGRAGPRLLEGLIILAVGASLFALLVALTIVGQPARQLKFGLSCMASDDVEERVIGVAVLAQQWPYHDDASRSQIVAAIEGACFDLATDVQAEAIASLLELRGHMSDGRRAAVRRRLEVRLLEGAPRDREPAALALRALGDGAVAQSR